MLVSFFISCFLTVCLLYTCVYVEEYQDYQFMETKSILRYPWRIITEPYRSFPLGIHWLIASWMPYSVIVLGIVACLGWFWMVEFDLHKSSWKYQPPQHEYVLGVFLTVSGLMYLWHLWETPKHWTSIWKSMDLFKIVLISMLTVLHFYMFKWLWLQQVSYVSLYVYWVLGPILYTNLIQKSS